MTKQPELSGTEKELIEALKIALPYIKKVAATQPTEMGRAQRKFQAVKDVEKIAGLIAVLSGAAR